MSSNGVSRPAGGGSKDVNKPTLVQRLKLWWQGTFGTRSNSALMGSLDKLVGEGPRGDNALTSEEQRLFANILKLRRRCAADIMTPRVDIQAVPITMDLDQLLKHMVADGHSRMPVFDRMLDKIKGMIHVKDALSAVTHRPGATIHDILREVMFVSPGMSVLALLWQMRQSRHYMALVVDEFGGIDGLVTIEDLLEEIVGDIQDEFDEADGVLIVERPDGSFLIDARLPIEEFEDRVGCILSNPEREEMDTVGGLAFSLAGRVPARGETFTHASGIVFEIVEADPRRIKRVKVLNVPHHPNSSA